VHPRRNNDYLAKPVEMRQLAEVLAKWLPKFAPRKTFPAAEPSAPEQAKAVFDEQDLLNRLVRDRDLAGQIVKGFLEAFPSQLNNLRKRLDEGDGPGAAMQAHALRGAAAAVSAGSLRALAQAMERAGASRLVRDAEMTGKMLVETVSRIMADLARMGEAARPFARPAAARRAADVLEEVARV